MDGVKEGHDVGPEDIGNVDGVVDGSVIKYMEGLKEVTPDGRIEGLKVVGMIVGSLEDVLVGLNVGVEEIALVGSVDGGNVGTVVGRLEGYSDGKVLGVKVGE